MPEQEHDERERRDRRAKIAPGLEVFRVEREQHREQVDEDVVAVIVGRADGDLALVRLLLRRADAQPQETVRDDDHQHAEPDEVAVGDEAVPADRPQDEERRDAAEHHQQAGCLEACAVRGASVVHIVVYLVTIYRSRWPVRRGPYPKVPINTLDFLAGRPSQASSDEPRDGVMQVSTD